MKQSPMHIAIAGNIGSGKTTLAKLLGKHYNWEEQLEDLQDNPYITDFYEDMQRWSFNLQVYFLNARFNNIRKLRSSNQTVIQDRTIYEDAYIFAPNLHAMGLMSTRDFETYISLFQSLNSMIQAPDLLIYLRASIPTLVRQIQQRGRDYEDSIRLDYLKRLNERYEAWISTYSQGNLVVIDIDELDFLNNPADTNKIITRIEAELNGLF
jgi:deoxyadenosine/deoxycytidine kinase